MLRLVFIVIRFFFDVPRTLHEIKKYYKHMNDYSLEERIGWTRKLLMKATKRARVDLEISGTENLPKEGGYMMFPNHQGKYDVLAIVCGHDKPCSFVMDKKKSYMFMVRELVNLMDAKRMEIDNVRQALTVINDLVREVKAGKRYIIFPEGGYTNNHNTLQDFKPGSFKSATKAKVPVVPVCLIDTYKPFNSLSIKPVKNKVIFLEPIMPEEYADMNTTQLAEEVKSRIIAKMAEFGVEQ